MDKAPVLRSPIISRPEGGFPVPVERTVDRGGVSVGSTATGRLQPLAPPQARLSHTRGFLTDRQMEHLKVDMETMRHTVGDMESAARGKLFHQFHGEKAGTESALLSSAASLLEQGTYRGGIQGRRSMQQAQGLKQAAEEKKLDVRDHFRQMSAFQDREETLERVEHGLKADMGGYEPPRTQAAQASHAEPEDEMRMEYPKIVQPRMVRIEKDGRKTFYTPRSKWTDSPPLNPDHLPEVREDGRVIWNPHPPEQAPDRSRWEDTPPIASSAFPEVDDREPSGHDRTPGARGDSAPVESDSDDEGPCTLFKGYIRHLQARQSKTGGKR